MQLVRVAAAGELLSGELLEVIHDGMPIAVCNAGGVIRAVSGVCPHHGGPLAQGALEDGMITCPWHAWPFNLETGACGVNPEITIPVYSVIETDGSVFVEVP